MNEQFTHFVTGFHNKWHKKMLPAGGMIADKEQISDIILQQQHQIHSLAGESERLRKERDELLKVLKQIELSSANSSGIGLYPADAHCLVQYDSPVGAERSVSGGMRRTSSQSPSNGIRLGSSSSSARQSPDVIANGSLLVQAVPNRYSPNFRWATPKKVMKSDQQQNKML